MMTGRSLLHSYLLLVLSVASPTLHHARSLHQGSYSPYHPSKPSKHQPEPSASSSFTSEHHQHSPPPPYPSHSPSPYTPQSPKSSERQQTSAKSVVRCGFSPGTSVIGKVIHIAETMTLGRCCFLCHDNDECDAWVLERTISICKLISDPVDIGECEGECVSGVLERQTNFRPGKKFVPRTSPSKALPPMSPIPQRPSQGPISAMGPSSEPPSPGRMSFSTVTPAESPSQSFTDVGVRSPVEDPRGTDPPLTVLPPAPVVVDDDMALTPSIDANGRTPAQQLLVPTPEVDTTVGPAGAPREVMAPSTATVEDPRGTDLPLTVLPPAPVVVDDDTALTPSIDANGRTPAQQLLVPTPEVDTTMGPAGAPREVMAPSTATVGVDDREALGSVPRPAEDATGPAVIDAPAPELLRPSMRVGMLEAPSPGGEAFPPQEAPPVPISATDRESTVSVAVDDVTTTAPESSLPNVPPAAAPSPAPVSDPFSPGAPPLPNGMAENATETGLAVEDGDANLIVPFPMEADGVDPAPATPVDRNVARFPEVQPSPEDILAPTPAPTVEGLVPSPGPVPQGNETGLLTPIPAPVPSEDGAAVALAPGAPDLRTPALDEEAAVACRLEGVRASEDIAESACLSLTEMCGLAGSTQGSEPLPDELEESLTGNPEEVCVNLRLTSCVNNGLTFANDNCFMMLMNGPETPSEECASQPFVVGFYVNRLVQRCRDVAQG